MAHHTKMQQDEESVHFYPEDELVELVHSLDREEDQHLFAQDVLVSYPYLAEEYHKVCPHRMDLHSAAQRAARGDYSYDAKLTELRHDIDLMVNNCVRFNGESHPLSEIAESFQFFAQEALDAYIASKTGGRRVSLLRLQLSQHSPTSNNLNHNNVNEDVHKTIKPIKPTTLPSCTELMEFISHTLVRREDANAFVEDVTVAYPSLKESYVAICPVKMNLMMMRERAQDGYYTYESIKDKESLCKEIDETVINNNNENNNNEQDAKEHKSDSSQKSVSSSSKNSNKSKKGSNQESNSERKTENTSVLTNNKTNEEMLIELQMQKVFGPSVATSLHRLREDLELIVDNCIRFNINVDAWVKLALSFRKFAHRKVDELVLRHAPVLKGTATGVDVYVKQIHVLQQQQQQQQLLEKNQSAPLYTSQTITSNTHHDSILFSAQKAANAEDQLQKEENNTSSTNTGQTIANYAEVVLNVSNNSDSILPKEELNEEESKNFKKGPEGVYQDGQNSLKRSREIKESEFTINNIKSNSTTVKSHKQDFIPEVQVVHLTAPHITPSALQPEVHIPASLRIQIEHDYVQRDSIRLRRIGSMLSYTKLLPRIHNVKHNNNNSCTNENKHECVIETESETENIESNNQHESNTTIISKEEIKANSTVNSKTEKVATVASQMTSAFVLHLFMDSVHDYYHHRRIEPSFNTAFDYSAQDEQLYVDVIHVLAVQFDQLFTSLLLYPLELADAHAWQAVQLIKQTDHVSTLTNNETHSQEEVNTNVNKDKVFSWLEQVHYSYLVRFLVQFPQLACLICAQFASTTTTTTSTTMMLSSSASFTQHHNNNKSNLSNKKKQAAHNKNSTLQISRDVLVLLQRITKIVNECLQFIADYEEQLQLQIGQSAECLIDNVEEQRQQQQF